MHHKLHKIFPCAMLCTVLFLSACKEENKPIEKTLRHVRSIVVSENLGYDRQTFSGTLHAIQEARLSFKVSGTINNILVKVGDLVRKGDVVSTLDPTPYNLQAQKANASLVSADATFRNAASNYERLKELYKSSSASKNELDDARASYESTSASVESNRKALEIAQLNVDNTKLIIEDNCSISSIDAEKGENIVAGHQIFSAACGNELKVELDIPESVINKIKKDMPVIVNFSALADKTYTGTISSIGISSVNSGSTFPVDVMLDDKNDPQLKAGLSADVVFTFKDNASSQQVIYVPSFAVSEDEMGRFVFILEKSDEERGIVHRHSVEVGGIKDDTIEVLNGLKPKMRIITAGISVLYDGMEVKYSDE